MRGDVDRMAEGGGSFLLVWHLTSDQQNVGIAAPAPTVTTLCWNSFNAAAPLPPHAAAPKLIFNPILSISPHPGPPGAAAARQRTHVPLRLQLGQGNV